MGASGSVDQGAVAAAKPVPTALIIQGAVMAVGAVDPVTGGLLKVGFYLYKTACLEEKVDAMVAELMKLDANGDGNLSAQEIELALRRLKGQNNTAPVVNLRCTLLFVHASYARWEQNPADTDARLSKKKPFLVLLSRDPRRAKLQKILYTYYSSNGEKKFKQKLGDLVKGEVMGEIKSQVLEQAIGPIVEEILKEIYGEIFSLTLMAFLF
ncbi:hypothetical protein M885DRAFT_519949 [Pelagophyceae sp. CCMP2097]|nr:hypothetical protein M885DRAFT_519949 [Pelagophyceae sp. CCMP2097]